jgi:two-component system osmolarity sensor histidine kinase EnvZ
MKDDDAKRELEKDINEMTAMLNSYVNFVRGEAPEIIEYININHLITNICESSFSSKHQIIEKYIIKIETSGRPLQLKRAIQNIIDNSKRYSTIIHIELDANDEEFFIKISDNGPGIPESNYEDVFKPFFTLDPSRNKLKGESGLGMTIARDIIRSHGGEIKLHKSKSGGLETEINLPL